MARNDTPDPLHGGTLQVPRSRGALSGVLLIVLGAFGALLPLLGPIFDFGLAPKKTWYWTASRWWLEVLPGAVCVVGGLLLLLAANRIMISLGASLGVAAGVWFIVGRDLASLFHLGTPSGPLSTNRSVAAIETLAAYSGLGAVILVLAATAFGRVSVRSVRDVRAAQRREVEAELEQRRQAEYAQARQQQLAAATSSDEGGHGLLHRHRHDSEAGDATDDRTDVGRADQPQAGTRTAQQPVQQSGQRPVQQPVQQSSQPSGPYPPAGPGAHSADH